MQADGTRERLLFGVPGSDEWYPRFSPDGERIAFTRYPAGGASELWLLASDGTGARRLAAGA